MEFNTIREDIINVLTNSDRALSFNEIRDSLSINGRDDTNLLKMELKKLVDEILVYKSNKNKYLLLEKSHLRKGIMHANKKGFGFVEVEGLSDDVFIPVDFMNGSIHGDLVLVEITSKMNLDRLEGRILKIIERKIKTYIGEINFDEEGNGHIILDEAKVKLDIVIPKNKSLNTVDGHKVVVEIEKKITNNCYYGKVIEVIGHKDDPGVDILSVVYKYNIDVDFSDFVKEEVKSIPDKVVDKDLVGRKDLRDQVIFTIDGDDTKDIDDAISISKEKNGNYKLGVHIADVSYYVKENTNLDNEAYERGTSVYLVDRVIPMIPHELSNGICSLNEGVDRLAISCVMEFDNTGNMINYEIFPSVINSKKKMTYKNVNKILEKNVVEDDYKEFEKDIRLMEELAEILRSMKDKRGNLDFEVDEAKVIVDDNCIPQDIVLRDRGLGERLIEDFMIAANEAVASHIYMMNLPFIYRIHEYPVEEKIRSFVSFLGSLGYVYKGDLSDLSPRSVQKILKFLKDKKEYKILSSMLLRCMQKAIYSDSNLGHYGIASNCYTHFTSPIRRYPDTIVHRLLHTYLFDGSLDAKTCKKWEEKLGLIAEHSSEKERNAVDCEREVDDLKMAQFMESHVGEEFDGMISSITNFGIFVSLDNLVEGMVALKSLDDFYHFDEKTYTLTGEKTKKKYKMGDRLKVKIERASKEEKVIDFSIVKKYE